MENNNNTPATQEVEIDLIKLLFVFLHRWWVFAIFGFAAMLIAIAISVFYLTPLYQSSISLYVNNRMDNTPSDYVSTGDMSASRGLVSTYITISKSDRVMNAVAEALDGAYSSKYLKSSVSAKQEGQTELFTVTVTTVDPERSALIANTIAEVLPSVLSEIVEGSSAKVIDYGRTPESRSFPSHTKNALIGLLIGVILAGIIVLVEFVTDVRIMDEEDLSNITDYPLLGQIPDFKQIGKRGSKNGKYGYEQHIHASKAADKGADKAADKEKQNNSSST